MNPQNIDDKIADERHKARQYSSYSNESSATSTSSGFSGLGSYFPKQAVLIGLAIGIVIVGGGITAIRQSRENANGRLGDNNPVVVDKHELNKDGTVATEDGYSPNSFGSDEPSPTTDQQPSASSSKQETSSNFASDVFTSLGLIKHTSSQSSSQSHSSSSAGGSSAGSSSSSPSSSHPSQSPAHSPPSNSSSSPKVTKLLVFVVENHSLAQMKASMPYAYSLAKKYSYASNYTAIRHPSLPNYVAIMSGSTRGITDDGLPSANGFGGSTVFGRAIDGGKTALVFNDGMPTNCDLSKTSGDRYFVKHNAWAYATSERTLCKKYSISMKSFDSKVADGKLPNAGMVVPNNCNNAHDCSLKVADKWFEARMKTVFAGSDWKSGHLAIILTADEDDRRSENKVLTVVIHGSQRGSVRKCALNHYSLSRLYSDVTKQEPILNGKSANSMSGCFSLPL